jgi:hypothetical protein
LSFVENKWARQSGYFAVMVAINVQLVHHLASMSMLHLLAGLYLAVAVPQIVRRLFGPKLPPKTHILVSQFECYTYIIMERSLIMSSHFCIVLRIFDKLFALRFLCCCCSWTCLCLSLAPSATLSSTSAMS